MNKIICWINVFKSRDKYSISNIYADELTAIHTGRMVEGYYKTVSFEFEDGDEKEYIKAMNLM